MGWLESFIWCTIDCDLAKINLNISQPDLIVKMTQGFNYGTKTHINFSIPDKPHKGCLQKKK